MLVSVDIILDFDDIIYTELCFPIFFSYVYTYTADFVYSRRKNASFSICLQLLWWHYLHFSSKFKGFTIKYHLCRRQNLHKTLKYGALSWGYIGGSTTIFSYIGRKCTGWFICSYSILRMLLAQARDFTSVFLFLFYHFIESLIWKSFPNRLFVSWKIILAVLLNYVVDNSWFWAHSIHIRRSFRSYSWHIRCKIPCFWGWNDSFSPEMIVCYQICFL